MVMTCSQRSNGMVGAFSDALHLIEPHDSGDCRREPIPVCGFLLEMPATRAGQRVELGPPIVLGRFPFRGNPALVLELVERRIERALADLEDLSGDLAESN